VFHYKRLEYINIWFQMLEVWKFQLNKMKGGITWMLELLYEASNLILSIFLILVIGEIIVSILQLLGYD